MAEKKKKRRRLSGTEYKQPKNEETNAQILRAVIGRFFARFDLMQIIPLALLLTIGMCFVHSTGQQVGGHHVELFSRQCVYLAVGLGLWFTFIMLDYRWIGLSSVLFYPAVVAILILVLLFGPVRNNTRRWIDVGPVSLQPSELGKDVITLFMAKFLAARTRALESEPFWKVMVPSGIWVGPTILLVLAGEDLGTTVLLGSLYLLMLFVAGMRLRYILPFTLILPPVAVLVIKQFDAMRWGRLTVFMDAEAYKMTSGYQLWNSLLALGSGGWTGVGFTESRLKLMYLPENHTDFILSIVGEELGFITLLTVIVAYLIMVFVGLRISVKARTRQGMLIAFGMSIFIGMQALINIGVITAAFPTKGMPAPMISYGGSNLLACLVAAACVAGVAIDSAVPDYQDKLLAWVGKRLHIGRSSAQDGVQQSS